MSDIGLAGIPTSALKRDPTTGEVSPAHVDGSQSIEFGRQFVKNKSTSNATQTLKERLADSQTIRAEGEKLAYPMETGNPAYQARVSFRMYSLQHKDPAAAKKSHLAETPVDNTKKTANINAGLDETWQTPVGPTTVGSGTNQLSVIDDTVGTGDIDPRFTAQSGRFLKKLSQPLIDKGKAFIDNELVTRGNNTLRGYTTPGTHQVTILNQGFNQTYQNVTFIQSGALTNVIRELPAEDNPYSNPYPPSEITNLEIFAAVGALILSWLIVVGVMWKLISNYQCY